MEAPPALLGDVGSSRNHARQHVAVNTGSADLTVAFAWQVGVAPELMFGLTSFLLAQVPAVSISLGLRLAPFVESQASL